MNQTAKKIQDILESAYKDASFIDFIREIFPGVKIYEPIQFHKEFSNFSSHIEGNTHIGNYIDPDGKKISIHAVCLKRESYVENSRSTQRSYAKKLIEAGNADATIIAFYTEGDPKWRISFVRLDYEIKFENGKLSTKEKMTPARRYSYLVGEDEPSHTAISRFHNFIIDGENALNPTLDNLEEIFSVEKVTEEFFKQYCEKYHLLREALEANPDFVEEAKGHNFTSAQFAKKLMGQIVFLYFLQKKGWLGVGAWAKKLTKKQYDNVFFTPGAKGRIIKEYLPKVFVKTGENEFSLKVSALDLIPDDAEELIANALPGQKGWGSGSKKFMRTLFNHSKKKGGNFFDDYLEPLFYNALNVNRGNTGYDPELHCRIPFLSGGLFEPIDGYDWKHNDFAIPNEIFSNRKDDNDREGDGILDIFDHYNFTMSEDEPLEHEVAIDPEMLGKIFENLLEVNDRKSKGAFYTPREIVHYMCQETLIAYLIKETGLKEQDIRDFILLGDFLKDEDTAKDRRQGYHDMMISEEIYKIDKEGKVIVNRLKDIDIALSNIRVADPAVGSGAFPLGMLNEIVRARQNISAYMAITMNSYEKRMMYNNERSPYNLKVQTIKNCIFAADIEPSAVDIAQLRLWLSLVIDDEINPNADSLLDGHRNPIPLPNLDCNILCGNSLVDEFEGVPLINHSDLIGTNIEAQQNMFQSAFEAILPSLLKAQDSLFRCEDTAKKQELKDTIEALKDELVKSQMSMANPGTWDKYQKARRQASRPFVLWQIDFARVFREKGGFDVVIGNPPYVLLQDKVKDEKLLSYLKRSYSVAQYKVDLYHLFIEKATLLSNYSGVISLIVPSNFTTNNYTKELRKFMLSNLAIENLVFYDENVFKANVNNLVFVGKRASQNLIDNNEIWVRFSKRDGNAWTFFNETKILQNTFMTGNYIINPNANANSEEIIRTIEKDCRVVKNYTNVNFGMQLRNRKKYITDVISDETLCTEFHKKCYTGKDISFYSAVWGGLYCYFNREAKCGGCWDESAQFANPKILVRQIGKYPIAGMDKNGYPVLNTAFMISGFKDGVSPYFILGLLNSKLIRFYWLQKFSDNRKQFPKIKGTYLEMLPVRRNEAIEESIATRAKDITEEFDEKKLTEIDDLVFELYEINNKTRTCILNFCKENE